MSFITYEIKKHKGYLIYIGSLEDPDSKFEERVRTEIDKAMGAFERTEKSNHAIVITQDSVIETGESEIPELEPGIQYLIFALGYSPKDPEGRALKFSEKELNKMIVHKQKALETGFTELIENMSPKPKIGLVVLHDCTVSLILAQLPIDTSWTEGLGNTGIKSKWNLDNRDYDPPGKDRGE